MDDATMAMTPEERLAAGLCCECGTPLAGLDVPHHSALHWPDFIRPDGRNQEAMRRQALLKDYTAPSPPSRVERGIEHAQGSPSTRPPAAPPDRSTLEKK